MTIKGLTGMRDLCVEHIVAIHGQELPAGSSPIRYLRASRSFNTETTIFPSEAMVYVNELEAATKAADYVVKVYADLGLSVRAEVLSRKVIRMHDQWEPATQNVGASA